MKKCVFGVFLNPARIAFSECSLPRGAQALDFVKACKDRYPDPACIFIDTIQAVRNPSLKQDYASVENEFSPLRKLAHDLNITIVAVHHTKKKTDFETEPLDQILGSQAIAATVETILLLQRTHAAKTLISSSLAKTLKRSMTTRLFGMGMASMNPLSVD